MNVQDENKAFAKRLTKALKDAGYTPSRSTNTVGVNYRILSTIEGGSITHELARRYVTGIAKPHKLTTIQHIARFLKVNPSWLSYGIGSQTQPEIFDIPVLNAEEAMHADNNPEFAKIIERSTNTIPAFKAPSEFTFSIMLDSDEMSPTCPANSYAIFDPTLEAANESLVLVAPKNTTRAFFTQIFFKQGSTFTETLKRGSPTLPLEKGFKICGVYLDTFYP